MSCVSSDVDVGDDWGLREILGVFLEFGGIVDVDSEAMKAAQYCR